MPAHAFKATAIVLASLSLSTAAMAQRAEMVDAWPDWLKQAMTEESQQRKSKTVKTADGSVRTKMAGKPSEPQLTENGWYFISDLDAESPLECFVFSTAMDLASLTSIIAESNIEAVAEAHGTIGNRSIYYTGAGAIGEFPYLALEWIYTAGDAPDASVGLTKVRAAARGNYAFACSHNYLGYRETFADAFTTFVSNIEYTDDNATPYYEEIATISVAGHPTGIGHVSYTLDDEGDTRVYTLESSLTAVSEATLSTADATTISYSTPDGRLINTYSSTVENGEKVSELSLQRNENDDWVVTGTLQNKPIDALLDAAHTPLSELGQMAQARELFAESLPHVSTDVWVSSIDPTQFIEARMLRDDAEEKRQATLQLGPISYSGRFDEYGNMMNADMDMGPVNVRIERIWSNGQLPK